jgi:hypothetical protein
MLDELRYAGDPDLMDTSLHLEHAIAQVASPKPEDFRPTQATCGGKRECEAERLGGGARCFGRMEFASLTRSDQRRVGISFES